MYSLLRFFFNEKAVDIPIENMEKGITLVVDVNKTARQFTKEEIYGLNSQIKRSAISIPSYIAEGSGRRTVKDFYRFLDVVLGSSF